MVILCFISEKQWIGRWGVVCILLLSPFVPATANDSLTLAQSYINLSLTTAYFDSMKAERVARILPFVESQMDSIQDGAFLTQNAALFHFTYAHFHFLKAKYSFQKRNEINREKLLGWKIVLDSAENRIDGLKRNTKIYNWEYDAYFEMIGVTEKNYNKLIIEKRKLESNLNKHFNQDIYPDIRRIFYIAKEKGEYHFDSLAYFAALYDMHVGFSVLRNSDFPVNGLTSWNHGSGRYRLAFAIDLISRYLQLSYIAEKSTTVRSLNQVYEDLEYVQREVEGIDQGQEWSTSYDIPVDDFIRNEISMSAIRELGEKIHSKFPRDETEDTYESSHDNAYMVASPNGYDKKFYFPKVAPFPSSKMSIQNFIPDSTKMGQVDRYIKQSFESAGYRGRLHYFYLHEPGFAVTTGIERIEKDGSPKAPEQKRWDLTAAASGNFSLYQIFKAIFFATESDFRIIACVVSAKEAVTGNSDGSFRAFSSLLEQSYSSLPEDLVEVQLSQKTLTILVYHFYQSDIGQVPLLDTSKRLTVYQHLEKTSSLKNLTGTRP